MASRDNSITQSNAGVMFQELWNKQSGQSSGRPAPAAIPPIATLSIYDLITVDMGDKF
jgi:hypothetical protein